MPRVKSRITARYYATPHPYDVVVYREGGRYYAKDRKGNLICVDSPTSCLQETIDYVNNEKLGWIDNWGVGVIEVLTDIELPKQVVITPQNRIWIRFHGKVWIGWINPPSPDEPYGAIKIGDGSISTWVERPIVVEGGVFTSDPSKPNLYPLQINRIHGVVIRNVYAASSNLADVVGEATQTLIDHCQIASPPGIAIRFRTGPYQFGPGDSHVNRVLIQCGQCTPNSGGIAVYDNTIWITETWIESIPRQIVVEQKQGEDYPHVIIENSYIATSEDPLIGDLITIKDGVDVYPHVIRNNFFAIFNPDTHAINVESDRAEVIVEGNVVSLFNGAGFIKANSVNNIYTISRNKVRIFSSQKSNIFNITDKPLGLFVEGNHFYNYYYRRLEANGGIYSGPGSTTVNIPHGLGVTPSRYIVIPIDTTEPTSISADNKKITLNFSTAPDYVYILWYVEA
jgi:hypothetical protein